MIDRLPAIGISAFSAIIVAMPIAMLLNAVAVKVDEASIANPVRQLSMPIQAAPAPESETVMMPTDDGGEHVVAEAPVEKTE